MARNEPYRSQEHPRDMKRYLKKMTQKRYDESVKINVIRLLVKRDECTTKIVE